MGWCGCWAARDERGRPPARHTRRSRRVLAARDAGDLRTGAAPPPRREGADILWWTNPVVAEPFHEALNNAMARFKAIAAPVDIAGQLRGLQALLDDDVLTADDMRRAKDLFLGRAPDQRQVMERSLRSLFELKQAGVLNAVEFDIKKRDILATTK